MQYLGINYEMKHAPKLDPTFIPFGVWRAAYLKDAKTPIAIAVERDNGQISVHKTFIHGTPEMADADYRYVERYVKFLLWSIGGFKVFICGCSDLAKKLQNAYKPGGEREFDFTFVDQLYEKTLEIVDLPLEECPAANETAVPMGGHMNGCRIGFDAGGSDRKVSAVIDGECVYSEEVVWFPKTNSDPDYHYDGILSAMRSAAEHMPRVDAIGVSSAGVYVDNRIMVASLFLKVGKEDFEKKCKIEEITEFVDIFCLAGKTGGNLVEIINFTADMISQKIAVDEEIEVKEQQLEKVERKGYTVVEWGGSERK